MDRKTYTIKDVGSLLEECVYRLRDIPEDLHDEYPKAISYRSNIQDYDLNTLKNVGIKFNKGNRDFRCELGIVFANSENIDVDYIFIEVHRL